VLWDRSAEHLAAVLEEIGPNANLVITGFIAITAEGVATTLKRDGSDYRCVFLYSYIPVNIVIYLSVLL
jgi:aspartokinase